MSEIPDVVSGEPIEADWGNTIRDRVVSRYDSDTDPDLPAIPVEGDPAYFVDVNRLTLFDGSDWREVIDAVGGQTKDGFLRFGGSNASDVYIRPGAGSAASPSITFWGDPGTGFFRLSSGAIGISAGGGQAGDWRQNTLLVGQGNAADPQMRSVNGGGGESNPPFAFFGDADTGMFRRNPDEIAFATNGGQRLYIGEQLFVSNAINDATSGSPANVFISSGGQLVRSTSSKRFKREIRKLVTTKRRDALDVRLSPVTFVHKGDEESGLVDDAGYVGFIAEEVAEIDDRLAVLDEDGKVSDYDLRGVVAILAAQVNDLRDQLDRVISNGPGGA